MILVANFGIRSWQKTSMGDASRGKWERKTYRWPRRSIRRIGKPPCARRCRRTEARKTAPRPSLMKLFKLLSQG